MKALILCAGLGTRLGKLTKDIPKPMIKVAGKPVLEHLVDHLNKYGITEIIVNLHYKPEVIMNYFGTRLLYFYEPKLLGELGTMWALRDWLNDDYWILQNGDTLNEVDIGMMKEKSQGLNCITEARDWNRKEVYMGTRVYPLNFFGGIFPIYYEYWDNCYWQDIGTPEGLKKAREYYEKKSHRLS